MNKTKKRLVTVSDKQKDRAEQLRQAMLEISGFDCMDKSQETPFVIARAMIAQVLVEEGCTIMQAGKLIGKTHPTIVYYQKMMEAFTSMPGYDAERELWDKFKARI